VKNENSVYFPRESALIKHPTQEERTMLNQEEVKILRRMKPEGNTNAVIARTLNCHANTVAKHLRTEEEKEMPKKSSKLDPYCEYLKERNMPPKVRQFI